MIDLLTYPASVVGGPDWPPLCTTPECVDQRMVHAPQPGGFAFDVGGVKTAAFRAFDVDVDGRSTTIDSLHTLRRVERESEQRYRNGEGEPLRFRMWNQDRTNKDVGSFGTAGRIGDQVYDSGSPPPAKPKKVDIRRHGQKKPKIRVARHAGQSPLKD